MNYIAISGNITDHLELNQTKSGKTICQFSIAVNRYSATEDKSPMFIKCTAFEKTAQNLVKYCEKGSKVVVTGELDINVYTSQDGIKRTAVSVVVKGIEYLGTVDRQANVKPETAASRLEQDAIDIDDDLPF